MPSPAVRYKWDAHTILHALETIKQSEWYTLHFFPSSGTRLQNKWHAERDLCLLLLADELWMDAAARVGLVVRMNGKWEATDKWTSTTTNPVRSLLAVLRDRLRRRDGLNYFEKAGASAWWRSPADVPRGKAAFVRDYPYYFLLLELTHGARAEELPPAPDTEGEPVVRTKRRKTDPVVLSAPYVADSNSEPESEHEHESRRGSKAPIPSADVGVVDGLTGELGSPEPQLVEWEPEEHGPSVKTEPPPGVPEPAPWLSGLAPSPPTSPRAELASTRVQFQIQVKVERSSSPVLESRSPSPVLRSPFPVTPAHPTLPTETRQDPIPKTTKWTAAQAQAQPPRPHSPPLPLRSEGRWTPSEAATSSSTATLQPKTSVSQVNPPGLNRLPLHSISSPPIIQPKTSQEIVLTQVPARRPKRRPSPSVSSSDSGWGSDSSTGSTSRDSSQALPKSWDNTRGRTLQALSQLQQVSRPEPQPSQPAAHGHPSLSTAIASRPQATNAAAPAATSSTVTTATTAATRAPADAVLGRPRTDSNAIAAHKDPIVRTTLASWSQATTTATPTAPTTPTANQILPPSWVNTRGSPIQLLPWLKPVSQPLQPQSQPSQPAAHPHPSSSTVIASRPQATTTAPSAATAETVTTVTTVTTTAPASITAPAAPAITATTSSTTATPSGDKASSRPATGSNAIAVMHERKPAGRKELPTHRTPTTVRPETGVIHPQAPSHATETSALSFPPLQGRAALPISLGRFDADVILRHTNSSSATAEWLMWYEPSVREHLKTVWRTHLPASVQLAASLDLLRELLDPQGAEGRRYGHPAVRQVCTAAFLRGLRVHCALDDALLVRLLQLLQSIGMSRLNWTEFENQRGVDNKQLVWIVNPPNDGGSPVFRRRELLGGEEDDGTAYWLMSPVAFMLVVHKTLLHNMGMIRHRATTVAAGDNARRPPY